MHNFFSTEKMSIIIAVTSNDYQINIKTLKRSFNLRNKVRFKSFLLAQLGYYKYLQPYDVKQHVLLVIPGHHFESFI